MHKGKKHSIKEGYEDFARSEGAEAKKYVDSVRTNNPFGEGLDDIMDEESRRRERGYYVKGDVISQKGKKIVSTPDLGVGRKSALNMLGIKSPLNFKGANSSNSSCWKGYKKVGTKKSPSGTGETVNDCKKI
tara:strand:+ start:88 stop:483 length:396 start_codon:yes stop_codon:yes gene_type:complete